MAHHDEHDSELPAGLKEALKAADRPLPLITARVDREVAAMAEAHFAARKRRRLPRGGWAAAAAVVVVAVAVGVLREPEVRAPEVYADVDGSGHIDIADVLALARSADGVSREELAAFARRVVEIEREAS